MQSIYVLASALTAVIALALAVWSWRQRQIPSALAFSFLMAAVCEWAVLYTLELSSSNLAETVTIAKLEYIGIVALPTAWLVFALHYTGRASFFTRRNQALLAIFPLLTLALVWTNELHGLIWSHVAMEQGPLMLSFSVGHGLFFWAHTVYSYIMLLIGSLMILRVASRSFRMYRRQALALMVGVALPWASNAIYLSGLSPLPQLDPTPLAFSLSGVFFAWSIFSFGLLDLVPVARDKVLESMSDGVMIIDTQGRLVDANPVAMRFLGRKEAEIIGHPARELFASWWPLVSQFQDAVDVETELTLGERTFELRILPLYRENGQLSARLFLSRDISARKKAEVALHGQHVELSALYDKVSALEKLKTDMIRIAAHDLRNPLGITLSYVGMLKDQPDLTLEERMDYLNRIERAALRMRQITTDILSLERIQGGPQIAQEVDLRQVVERLVDDHRPLSVKKSQTLTVSLPPGPVKVRSDEAQLSEAAANLLSNAIKYTPAEGRIEICLQIEAGRAILEIKDTGFGIPEDRQATLFQPFSRVQTDETRMIDGTGLGLYLVKNIIERQGGKIRFQSIYQKGSTFGFDLPIVESAGPPASTAEKPASA
jgi:PAS domain S-box-containing protein